MNILEHYISNITKHEIESGEYDGIKFTIHHLVADVNCYGNIEYQKEIDLTDDQYQSVMETGYFIA